jgi:hypothetical protein
MNYLKSFQHGHRFKKLAYTFIELVKIEILMNEWRSCKKMSPDWVINHTHVRFATKFLSK